MKPIYFLLAALILSVSACDNNDDKTKDVDKNGSIEVALHTTHADSLKDILTTHYIVWSKGIKVKEFDVRDTIPSLGKVFTEAENNAGDTRDVSVPKDYQFFVTVK